jgi:hypothetical protein
MHAQTPDVPIVAFLDNCVSAIRKIIAEIVISCLGVMVSFFAGQITGPASNAESTIEE